MATASASTENGTATNGKKPFQRLPNNVEPVQYDIKLKPDLKKFSFDGWMTIRMNVREATDTLVCNAAELKVSDVKVKTSAGKDLEPTEVTTNEEEETLVIKLAEQLPQGESSLSCAFVGELNDKMRGFYRSKYTQDGEERYCAVTQFEATDARRCFPSWDEPAHKATFNITVIAPKDRTVHSNMPEVSTQDYEEDKDWKVVKFDTSPKMSTYLVCIVVGEFESVEGVSKEGTQVRVFTPLGKKDQGVFAKDTSIRALTFYKDFFNIAYPLPKYDCIAIADFQCGAMENWGLVTYRESCILVDEANTSSNSKQWISIVVTHEMAHQWFGNLVTMGWWTHLWLNEGFASFCENTCTNALFPEFGIWTQFVTDTLIPALELDAMKNSHPIEVEVGHPSEVDEIFDNISYNKGASVIRMLYNYIGDEAFRSGMHQYLTKYSYKNAETADLWASLEEASKKPVGAIMSTWTSQMGFPVIKVQSRMEGSNKVLTLTQEKFSADGSKSDGYFWRVPISILTAKGSTTEILLESDSTEVVLEGLGEGDWFKLNPGFVGYYRVQYSPEDMALFRPVIENKTLGEVDRLNLLDDQFALVQAGKASTVDALKLIQAFRNEDSYVVWSSISNCIGKLAIIIADQDYYEAFKRFVIDIMTPITSQVGWEVVNGEDHTRGLLRMLCISRMGRYGHAETVAEARKRFDSHPSKPLLPDLRGPVYRVVMANGDNSTFEQMVKLFKENELHEEKDRLARSMGACNDKDVLGKVLEFSISEEVRSQDSPFVIGSVATNPRGRKLAWEFFKANYAMLQEKYKTGMLMSRLCKNCTENFATTEMAAEIETFFKENPNPAERTIRQGIETILLNAAWLQRDGAEIEKFFKSL